MKILRAAVSAFSGGTALAMDLTRTEMFRSIQSDKDTAVEAAERIEDAFGFDGLKEQRIERLGGDAVEHLADMGVGGDFVYSKQGSLLQNSAADE